ncbi:MAG: hypothetical protein KF836_05360 [Fimbriimonadaceae bacterium]|nr:hypothetical protein [Fimbriimonadaceae bacterium]
MNRLDLLNNTLEAFLEDISNQPLINHWQRVFCQAEDSVVKDQELLTGLNAVNENINYLYESLIANDHSSEDANAVIGPLREISRPSQLAVNTTPVMREAVRQSSHKIRLLSKYITLEEVTFDSEKMSDLSEALDSLEEDLRKVLKGDNFRFALEYIMILRLFIARYRLVGSEAISDALIDIANLTSRFKGRSDFDQDTIREAVKRSWGIMKDFSKDAVLAGQVLALFSDKVIPHINKVLP